MGKKERKFNPNEVQRKLDKKKEKQKAKENLKESQSARAAQQELRAIEQEMTQFLKGNTDIKLATSAAFQAKLGQINDARVKLNLSTKGVDDFQAQFKEIKKQLKDAKKQEQASSSSRHVVAKAFGFPGGAGIEPSGSDLRDQTRGEDIKETKEYDERDLSTITLPTSGIAPETEGQMYHGLSQLRVVKCSKVLLARKEEARRNQKQHQHSYHPYNHQSSSIPPPPPPFPLMGGFMPPFMFPLPVGMPFNGMGMFPPPPPPPLSQNQSRGLSPNHSRDHQRPSSSSLEGRQDNRQHEHQHQGRFYATSSHAKEPTQDPLAPEIAEPFVGERQKQQPSQIVYGSAPQMRNIQKEVTGFVPAALLRKKTGGNK